jgi:hypothetical protein
MSSISIQFLPRYDAHRMISELLCGTHALALTTILGVCIMSFRPTSDVPTQNESGAINIIQLVLDNVSGSQA